MPPPASSLKVVAHGIQFDSAVAPGGPGEVLRARATSDTATAVDLTGVQPRGADHLVVVSFVAPSPAGDKEPGSVDVNLSPLPHARRRGWSYLAPTAPGVLAYQLHGTDEGKGETLLLMRSPDTANFLSRLPDNMSLTDVSMAGTHESCATSGFFISQCQQSSTPIAQQLQDGIRFFDIRLRVKDDELKTYHGIRNMGSDLVTQIDTINAFLRAHPRETVFISIKEETPPADPQFGRLVFDVLNRNPEIWTFAEHIPTLGDARGRGLVLTRFGTREEHGWPSCGIHPSHWPDSRKDGFDWDCLGTAFRIQDWYRVSSFLQIPDKTACVLRHLAPTLEPRTRNCNAPFTLSFLSASVFPFAPPQWIAQGVGFPTFGMGIFGVNARVVHWLLERAAEGRRPHATLMVDFYRKIGDGDANIAELLAALNFI